MLHEWQLAPGETFPAKRAVAWFAAKYPKLKSGSIDAHLVQASTNDPSRLHHPSTNTTDDLLFRVGSREYRLYSPGTDPAPIHPPDKVQVHTSDGGSVSVSEEEDVATVAESAPSGSSQFLLEKDLQRYLAENLNLIEPGPRSSKTKTSQGWSTPLAEAVA